MIFYFILSKHVHIKNPFHFLVFCNPKDVQAAVVEAKSLTKSATDLINDRVVLAAERVTA